jgi:succinoglycan biosynthesis transport protein ExoP
VENRGPASAPGFLRRRFLAILIPLLLVPGAAFAFSELQDKEYESQTSLLFRDTGPLLASGEPEREAATNVRLAQLPVLKERVEARLGRPVTEDVDVVAEEESNLATLIVTAPEPRRAADVANAYAQEFIDLRRHSYRKELANEKEAVRGALADLGRGGRSSIEGQALAERQRELRLAAAAPSGVEQLNRAEPPSSPSSPKPVQNTVIGAMIGLALGLALAIALERRDRRVRDPRYMEYVLGRPIIGRIPRSRALAQRSPGTTALPPAEAEAFRTVRANLRQQLREHKARSVLVTSAIPGEGKTTVVWNLARVEAASGTRVLLVEADMRRPVLAHSLGANGTAGLSELLADEAPLQDLIRPVGFDDSSNGSPRRGAVDVLFAGRVPANPAELLDSRRMRAVLEVIPDIYDLVVLDTPPTVVSDAMPILDQVGGVVVVGRLGLSTDASLIELREQLDQLEAPTLGVVVNAHLSASAQAR